VSVEEVVFSVLSGSAPLLSASAGIAARIKPPGDWQGLQKPYIVHKPISFEPTHTHDAVEAIDHYPNYQITAVGETYAQARTIADLAKAAIRGTGSGNHNGVQFFLRNEITLDYDTDRKTQEITLDFEVFQ